MIRRAILFSLALAAPLPAAAQGADQDVRCLIASNIFASAEKDANKKQVAMLSTFFYLGRIDGKLSVDQLKSQILAQGKTMNAQSVGPVMNECAKQLQTKQQTMQAIGQELARSQGLQPKAAPKQ